MVEILPQGPIPAQPRSREEIEESIEAYKQALAGVCQLLIHSRDPSVGNLYLGKRPAHRRCLGSLLWQFFQYLQQCKALVLSLDSKVQIYRKIEEIIDEVGMAISNEIIIANPSRVGRGDQDRVFGNLRLVHKEAWGRLQDLLKTSEASRV